LESRAGNGSNAVSTVVVVAAGTALWWRRTRPLIALVVVTGVLTLSHELLAVHVLFFGQFVPFGVAVFSAARHGRGKGPWLGAGLAAASLLYIDLRIDELQAPGEIFFHWGVTTVVWCFGAALRINHERAEDSRRRAVEVEVDAARQTMAAVTEERTRIARELHDVVAHAVTSMVVQAGAAEQVVDDDPAFTRSALASIRRSGTEALGEMRRLVTMLRSGDDTASLAPQPGVEGIGELVQAAADSGLEASLELEGDPYDLPTGLDLAAYRVVQEALTNVRRHSGASKVEVRLRYALDHLAIEVRDDGVGAKEPRKGGHGLVGMRERAALYGGEIDTGPLPDRGFRVLVRLPVVTG